MDILKIMADHGIKAEWKDKKLVDEQLEKLVKQKEQTIPSIKKLNKKHYLEWVLYRHLITSVENKKEFFEGINMSEKEWYLVEYYREGFKLAVNEAEEGVLLEMKIRTENIKNEKIFARMKHIQEEYSKVDTEFALKTMYEQQILDEFVLDYTAPERRLLEKKANQNKEFIQKTNRWAQQFLAGVK